MDGELVRKSQADLAKKPEKPQEPQIPEEPKRIEILFVDEPNPKD